MQFMGRSMHRTANQSMLLAAVLTVLLSGCTSFRDYVHNGFKVGPNYHRPPALSAEHWIDESDKRVRTDSDDLASWWTVFNDPLLNQLMNNAYQQNLTLRQAGFRVLESRAQLAIARGEFFPQTQTADGSFTRSGIGQVFTSQWNLSFNLAWELDFWGRLRRAIIAGEDTLDASVFDYDDALVTLLGDLANAYVNIRTDQEQIRLLENAVRVQENVLTFVETQRKTGFHGVTDLDKAQAVSNLKQSQAQIAQFQIDMRTQENSLCTLLGIPVVDIEPLLNSGPKRNIPVTPATVVVGMPADLLRRRPDVRKAERAAAAQSEQIGIAEAQLYPAFSINGTLGWQAATFSKLFEPQSLNSSVGPSFNWNLLNYGRLVNGERLQDATFRELVAAYQQSVLNADQEVENGIVNFLKSQEKSKLLRESVDAAYLALEVVIAQYENPTTIATASADFNRYATILEQLITQQEQWATARGQIALGLIQTYRALGGGWQIRCNPQAADGTNPSVTENPSPAEEIPLPNQELIPAPQSAPQESSEASNQPQKEKLPIVPGPATPPADSAPGPAPSSRTPATTSQPAPATLPPAPMLVPSTSSPADAAPVPPSTVPSTSTPPAGNSSLRVLPTTPSTSPSDLPSPMPSLSNGSSGTADKKGDDSPFDEAPSPPTPMK
jgi:NodT family efflux transporter outer membrane factor (OMF) lipoprotein